MADLIFRTNSSSLQDVEVSASLRAGPGIVVDFTKASTVSGSFAGHGGRLTDVSASYIVPTANATASNANTASVALFANTYAGLITDITVVDNNDGTVTISSASVNLFSDPDGVGIVKTYFLPSASFAIDSGSAQYIIVNYNGGSPAYQLTADPSIINQITVVPATVLSNIRGEIRGYNYDNVGLALANRLDDRLAKTEKFIRQFGLLLFNTGSGFMAVTDGALWDGATQIVVPAFNSMYFNGPGTVNENYFYHHSSSLPSGSFAVEEADVRWNTWMTNYYDNGTDLTPITNSGWYVVNYVWRLVGGISPDEDMSSLVGNAYATLNEAKAESVPLAPTDITELGVLVGRAICQSGSATPVLIESAFATTFQASTVTNHENLDGLQGGTTGQHAHLTFAEYTGTGAGVFVRQSGSVLTASLQGTASQAVSASRAVSSSNSNTSSYLSPGATFYQVSGSNGISQSFIEPYDYNPIETSYRPDYKEGRIFYDARYVDWCYYPHTASGENYFRFHLGKEVTIGVHNPYATTLTRLTPVYISGSTGVAAYRPDVYKAVADGTGLRSDVVGVIRNDIPSGSDGFMLMKGVMHRVDMSAYGTVGTTLWLDPNTPGALTTTKPGQPNEVVEVGYVSEAGALGSFICDLNTEPVPANAYAGMTSYPQIVDNTASLELYVDSASVNLYLNPLGVGEIVPFALSAVTFSVPTSPSASFIFAATNGVTASYGLSQNFSNINGTSIVPVATVYRADEDVHWMESNNEGLALANKIELRLLNTEKFGWQSGFTLVDTGSNQYVITAGDVWFGATQISQDYFDSTLTESVNLSNMYNETHWVYHSASQWIVPTASAVQTLGKYNNLYYDNGTNLTPLSSGYYCTNYFFRILGDNQVDHDTFIVIGGSQYADIASAENDSVPGDIPTVLSDVGVLVGRMIVLSGSTTASKVESAFTTNFGSTAVTTLQHNNLIGLQGGIGGQYYHLSAADYTGTGTGVMVRQDGASLTNASISGSITSASYVKIAQTASYVQAANVVGTLTATQAPIAFSASWVSASAFITTAQTASYVQAASVSGVLTADQAPIAYSASWVSASNFITTAQTASYVQAANVSGVLTATQAPIAFSSSWVSASAFITTAQTASYVQAANVAGTLTATQAPIAFSASWVSASAFITTAQTASYVTASNIVGTVASAVIAASSSWVSASAFITTAQTASYVTASNIVGTVAAAVSASWATSSYSSSITTANVDAFYRIVLVTGSSGQQPLYVDADFRYNTLTNQLSGSALGITASLFGTASNAISSSYSVSSSYAVTASFAQTASYLTDVVFAYVSGSNLTHTGDLSAVSTNLSFSVNTGEIWMVRAQMTAQSSNNRGLRWAISASNGATFGDIEGQIYANTSALTAFTTVRVNSVNAILATSVDTQANVAGSSQFNFIVVNPSTPTTVSIAYAVTNVGDTATVIVGSFMKAERVR